MNIKPENTAITRSRESVSARAFVRYLRGRVLDFGCGKGKDIEFYQALGFETTGFDLNPEYNTAPAGLFDTITCSYVLNTVPTPAERQALVQHMASLLAPGGRLLITCRSPHEIDWEAGKKGWTEYSDGYLSSTKRGTFQKGISLGELSILAASAGLEFYTLAALGSDTTGCILVKAS